MRALDKIIPTYCTRVCTYTSNIVKSVPDSTLGNCDVLGELRSIKGAGLGMLSANVNVDSATDIPHNERDVMQYALDAAKGKNNNQLDDDSKKEVTCKVNQNENYKLSQTI